MFNWIVTLVNTVSPFDTKQTMVHADTIIEAFDEKNHGNPGYYPRSARMAHDEDVDIYHHHMVEIAGG